MSALPSFLRHFLFRLACVGLLVVQASAVPVILNHQGRISVAGVNFDGPGQFKFALVDAAGTTSYWSNDGTSVAGSEPAAAVALAVTKGLYAVLLGDAALANMSAVPPAVFDNDVLYLRVWFNDGVNGFELISPDHRLAAAPYAVVAASAATAASATSVPDGSITSAKIASGAVGTDQLATASVTSDRIATGAVGSMNLAPGALATPVSIPGTSQAALPNTSYLATANGSVTSIELPTAATAGDLVQITGIGTGGWVASIAGGWVATGPSAHWQAVASSADGSKLIAATGDFEGTSGPGPLYTSSDFGATWTARLTDADRNWAAVASSADGTKLVALENYVDVLGGGIFTSTDSGVTWTAQAGAGQRYWWAVASSADGTKLVATAAQDFPSSGIGGIGPGEIFTSTDSGVTWTAQAGAGLHQWGAVTSSADGTKLAAVDAGGKIYTSTDSGVNWTARMTDADRVWIDVASSADGTVLLAVEQGAQLYTSTDSGVTWTAQVSEGLQPWTSVASSADGSRLVATQRNGVHTSIDSGASWTMQAIERDWLSVASSADGSRLVALDGADEGEGFIYTNGGNYGSGGQGTTATFQFLDSNRWAAISQTQVAPGVVGSTQLAPNLALGGTTTGTFAGTLNGSATNFSGMLAGDVTGPQSATAIPDTTVTGKLLTGFVSGAGTVTATDSILTAINKLSANAGASSQTLLGDVVAPPLKPVVAWGDNHDGQTTVPALANVAAVAAGNTQSLALLNTGTVVAWGTGPAVPGGLSDVTHIAAGTSHFLARKGDGTVTAWGNDTDLQATVPGGITTATRVAAGEKHSLALLADGTVIAWGDDTFDQTSIPGGLSNVTAIAAGYDHSLALKADGTVVAWGRDEAGQVTGTYPNVGVILEIVDATHYVLSKNLAAGTSNLRYDGTTVLSSTSDGSNVIEATTTGLAAGMTVTLPDLVSPAGLTNVVAIAAGAYHSLAVKSDGSVVAWGWDSGGQSNVPSTLNGVSKVAAGYAFSVALKTDGTLVVWGDNSEGQASIPAEAINVSAIAAGASHILALRAPLIPAQVARLDQDNVFSGKVGIGRTPATNKLEVEGNASKSAAGSWLANSDRRIKTEIEPLSNALQTLDRVRLVDFRYTGDYLAAHPGIEDKRYLNVLAQEFAEVFPDHVKGSGEYLPNGSEILQVDTYPLTIYSAAAVQELHRENRALKKQLAEQEQRLRKLEETIKP